MDNPIIKIGIAIVGILVFIYAIKNLKNIMKIAEKYKENKIIKYIGYVFIFFIIIYFIYYIYQNTIILKEKIEWYEISKENDLIFEKYDELINKESKYYNEKINLNYENQKFNEPYIPEGFSYVEGEWNTGFVIQDQNENQYVWVPCTNNDNAEVPRLERKNWSGQAFISKDICNNNEYEKFIKSALENGGFYISRFEIGKDGDRSVSKMGMEIWSDITRNEAVDLINSMYDNKTINCELINGYAYDTTLAWLKNTNQIKENIIKGNNKKILSGRNSYNNIYDFTDNIMEITNETTYSNVIIRGFAFGGISEEQENISMYGYEFKNFDRFSIQENENFFTVENKLAFRTVLYK